MSPYPIPMDVVTPCAKNPDLHFSRSPEKQEAAKHVCGTCPYRDPCAMWAITRAEIGIWGKTDDREREKFRRQNGIVAEAPRSLLPRDRRNGHIAHGTAIGVEAHRRCYDPTLCEVCAEFDAKRKRRAS